jgi:hypothetical protein
MSDNGKRPMWMPQIREFSQADQRVVQRPEGLDGGGAEAVERTDPGAGRVVRYAEMQASPGRFDEAWALTNTPQLAAAGGVTILIEKDLAFPAHSVLIDNWTNQWLNDANLRRFIPPYSGGWVLIAPKGYQQARILLKAPSASYTPAGVIAGEFVWVGWHEAVLPPATGVITLTKTPVVA